MSGQAVRIIAVLAALSLWGGGGLAQDSAPPMENSSRIFERLEQQDQQTLQDGFVLDRFEVRQRDDPRPRSMQLSIGRVDGQRRSSAFGQRPPSNYLLDPMAEPEAPPLGLNLRLQF